MATFSRDLPGFYRFLRPTATLIGTLLIAYCSGNALAFDAQIVSLQGEGEARAADAQDWQAAVLQQRLAGGSYVRTLDYSQMALLLRDQTQLRLNQNSQLQIKSLAGAGQPTRLQLQRGRSWMQYKGPDGGRQAATPRLEIETPNAVAAIRGTDWELAVEPAGDVVLTVFSGEAEFYNAYGRISVRASEQARAAPGQAPVKTLLIQARDRIQWVTAYRPDPARWGGSDWASSSGLRHSIDAGRYAEAIIQLQGQPELPAILVQADLLIADGRLAAAIELLENARRQTPPSGRLPALLARAYLLSGQPQHAAGLLQAAQAQQPQEPEVWLASGDLARYQGDAAAADAAYRNASELAPADAHGWFGQGLVASEREYVRRARAMLQQALQLDTAGPGFRGEAGTLETFADDFAAAGAAFEAALSERPDDYVALTGYGLLQLKRGDDAAALNAFLKAGVIEPRYARAAMYTGIAYYRQGRFEAADDLFRRAAELDPRDPLPHVLLSIAAGDAGQPGAAVAAAQAAMRRLPYLKSLNQLLNNQKGSVNTGTALAEFGLEDWARHYAYRGYNPYWAGSHLFLADRFNGEFNKNSELMQGFLTDPTVFGASNRFSGLLPQPGDYATVSASALRQSFKLGIVQTTLNGYHNRQLPLAYFIDWARLAARPMSEPFDSDLNLFTVGLGLRPRHDIGLFLFANRQQLDSTLTDKQYFPGGTPQDARLSRADLGLNLKFRPDSQSWFKIGSGLVRNRVDGQSTDTRTAQFLNDAFAPDIFNSSGDYLLRADARTDDIQWRHVLDINPYWQAGFGIEYARLRQPGYSIQYLPSTWVPFFYSTDETADTRSAELHLTNRLRPADKLLLQVDVSRYRLRRHFSQLQRNGFVEQFEQERSAEDDTDLRKLDPRLGLAWQALPGHTLRAAWQQWHRPAGQNTLNAVDSAGIVLDDRLVQTGGSLQRARGQYEIEFGGHTFVSLYGDRRKIDNRPLARQALGGNSTSLRNLDLLRKLEATHQGATDIYDYTPYFASGRVSSGGFAVNHILLRNLSAQAGYTHQASRNCGGDYAGYQLPLLPRHLAQLGGTWLPQPRWKLELLGLYRSARYIDEANGSQLASGWNGALRSSWQSAGKHFGVNTRLENLLSRPEAGFDRKPLLRLDLIWRL